MAGPESNNQRLRTRKDLLRAGAQLLKAGRTLTIDEVAKEALVSRATAYRYFSDIDALLTEVTVDESMPDPAEIFHGDEPAGIAERLKHAEEALHDYCYKNERQLRLMLSRNLASSKQRRGGKTPSRQNRRSEYIAAALAPYRDQLDRKALVRLSEALALVFGPESMIVFRDVVPVSPERAKEVKSWMVDSLVSAALAESKRRR
ncbi:MAG: TetR/AcrR family transcriptional regulator [Bdellovibrionota bacterium]